MLYYISRTTINYNVNRNLLYDIKYVYFLKFEKPYFMLPLILGQIKPL